MINELNKAAREATERDLEGWHMTNGTIPGQNTGIMLCIMSGSGKPYAIGCGGTELEAVNALVDDMTKRARKWIELRRTVRVWRDALRTAADDSRAERSAEFLSRKKISEHIAVAQTREKGQANE
jgi:hypothetical protein